MSSLRDVVVRPYGRDAVLVELTSGRAARALAATLRAQNIGGPTRFGWANLLVPTRAGESVTSLTEVLRALVIDESHDEPDARLHTVPVVYDGTDLADVASAAGLTVHEVIERHHAPLYRVMCLGFSRGFPYLEGLDPALQLPRRATPRVRVPAGSVAIAGEQAGIYPMASPGGWHRLGTTTFPVFDPGARPPAAFAPGDRIRFEPR